MSFHIILVLLYIQFSLFLDCFVEMRHLESNRISQNTVTEKMMVKTVTFLQKTNRVESPHYVHVEASPQRTELREENGG